MVSAKEGKCAFREVKLVEKPKNHRMVGFEFYINGVKVMAKGSNWVPMDAFHSRDAERYAAALALVKDIGCNILRCWGGNVYEDDIMEIIEKYKP